MISDRCSICGFVYGEPWKALGQSYDERTCEECKRSVCVEHFVGGYRICTECAAKEEPIPMLLFCPNCGMQHVDAPDPSTGWTNPVHKSHTCRIVDGGCGAVWRPADVPTTGVAAIETRGKADTWPEPGGEGRDAD